MSKNLFSIFLVVFFIFSGCSSKEEPKKEEVKISKKKAYSEFDCEGFKLKQDGELFFYRVQPGDTLSEIAVNIRKKCGEKFGYLVYEEYAGTQGFNIPSTIIRYPFLLAVPIEKDKLKITEKELGVAVDSAVKEMKLNRFYKVQMKDLLDNISMTELKKTVYAYAMAESELGDYSLVRWEKKYHAYSFSYFHILMEQAKGEAGPGLKARNKLNLTEGDVVANPEDAVKLFLGYWFEKPGNHTDCLALSEKNYRECGKIYNGSYAYSNKLWRFHRESSFK